MIEYDKFYFKIKVFSGIFKWFKNQSKNKNIKGLPPKKL